MTRGLSHREELGFDALEKVECNERNGRIESGKMEGAGDEVREGRRWCGGHDSRRCFAVSL